MRCGREVRCSRNSCCECSIVSAVEEPLIGFQIAEDAIYTAVFEREFIVVASEAAFPRTIRFRSRIGGGSAIEMRSGRGRRGQRGYCLQILRGHFARMCSEHTPVVCFKTVLGRG